MENKILDNNILQKAIEGDQKSFENLILPYEKLYFNIAYRMLNNYEEAKDVTQDSLIKIYKNLVKCTDLDSFKSWSCKILTNTCIDEIRAKKRKYTESLDEKIEFGDDSFEKQIPSNLSTPEEQFIKKESQKIVLEAIDSLKENYKSMIIMRDLNGFTYEEIAEVTNNSLGTVKSRINRGRNILKEILVNKLELKKNIDV